MLGGRSSITAITGAQVYVRLHRDCRSHCTAEQTLEFITDFPHSDRSHHSAKSPNRLLHPCVLIGSFISSPPARSDLADTTATEKKAVDLTGETWDNASAPEKIKWMLEARGHDMEWGWVVYRTSYKPELDVAWEKLKQTILNQSRGDIAESEVPELVDQMNWIFVEDAATLEGASREDLRIRFQAFARDEMAGFLPERLRGPGFDSRYEVFLQADEGSLMSLLPDSIPVVRYRGFVNIVKACLLELPRDMAIQNPNVSEDPDDPHDPED
ncbi:hypothetical protein PG987_014569 [Apiospora arundinis]